MPVVSSLLLFAQLGAQGVIDKTVEIPVLHQRPSKIVSRLKSLGVDLIPDDTKSVIRISGQGQDAKQVREMVALMDTPRVPIRLRVQVESTVDHLKYEMDAKLYSGQKWKTGDQETGLDVALLPRLDANNELTVMLFVRGAANEATSSFRLKKDQPRSVIPGQELQARLVVDNDGSRVEPRGGPDLPKITLTYLGQ